MWFVYILRCADDALYIGVTNDLANRLVKHKEGSASHFTASRRPLHLAYFEVCRSKDEAFERERQLKGWTRAKKEALIAGDRNTLKAL